MSRTLKNYLSESTQDGMIVIKTAFIPAKEQVDAVKRYLERFGLSDFNKPAEVEHDGMDFINIPNRKVYKMAARLSTAISSYVMQQELKNLLNVTENFLVVRNAQEPIEVYAEREQERLDQEAEAAEKGLSAVVRLSTDRFYRDDEQPVVKDTYGNEYNRGFLSYLDDVAKSRKSTRVEPSSSLFSWLEMDKVPEQSPVQDPQNFNAHIPGAPGAEKTKKKVTKPVNYDNLNPTGGFANSAITQPPAFEKTTSRSRKAK